MPVTRQRSTSPPSVLAGATDFLAGTATAYKSSSCLSSNGRWTVTPASTAAYKTRLVVYRPIDPKRFDGTVVVEWLNVSGGVDATARWGW